MARLLRVSGRHAERCHDQYVGGMTPRAVEFDEQWSFVQKKQKRCQAEESDEAGAQWDHRAVAADSKLLLSLVVGKRTYEYTFALGHEMHDRLRLDHLPAIFTDAFASYESALLEVFGRRYPPTGQGRRPLVRWRQGLAYGQGKKSDKKGRVDRVEVRAVQRTAHLEHVLYLLGDQQINTRVVERYKGTSSVA